MKYNRKRKVCLVGALLLLLVFGCFTAGDQADAGTVHAATESTGGTMNEKKLKNPYTDPVFVLRVPQAPEEEDSKLVDGDYQGQKPKVSKGIQ